MHNYDYDMSDAMYQDEWCNNRELRQAKREIEHLEESLSIIREGFQELVDILGGKDASIDFSILHNAIVKVGREVGTDIKCPTIQRSDYYKMQLQLKYGDIL